MGLNRRKLKEWVARRCLAHPPPERFALMHVTQTGASLVCRVEAEGAADDRGEIVERHVSEEAKDHVEGWPGRQQYKVVALSGDDAAMGEHPFTLQATGGHANEASASLSLPTPDMGPQLQSVDGVTHAHTMVTVQQMRHNEGLVRSVVDLAMSARERDAEIIAGLQRQVDKMNDRHLDFFELLESMLSRKKERELSEAAYEDDKKRKDALLGQVMGWVLPSFAKELGMQLPGDVALQVKEMFFRLPDETQTQILRELPEPDRDRLVALLESVETQH